MRKVTSLRGTINTQLRPVGSQHDRLDNASASHVGGREGGGGRWAGQDIIAGGGHR
jgi:hypothetical protein